MLHKASDTAARGVASKLRQVRARSSVARLVWVRKDTHFVSSAMSTWFGSKEKDPAAAAKKREEKEQKAVTQLRQLLLSSEGQQAAQQLVQGGADNSDDHRCFCNLVIHGLPAKIAAAECSTAALG